MSKLFGPFFWQNIATKLFAAYYRGPPRKYSLLTQFNDEIVSDPLESIVESSTVRLVPDRTLNKYQYAIYELFNAEINIYTNINKLINIYQKPMLNYRLISPHESTVIFSDLAQLAKIHIGLIKNLATLQINGLFECPVPVLLQFVETSLHHYEIYCLNLFHSKLLLRKKMEQKAFANFLQSEQIRKFSEKLDLFSHLDQPRRHLMKYPLLFAEIGRRTANVEENNQLKALNKQITAFIQNLDDQIAAERYRELLVKLEFSGKRTWIRNRMLATCTRLIIALEVQQSRKTWPKYRLILLDQMLLLVRCSTLGNKLRVLYATESGTDLYYHQGKTTDGFNQKIKNKTSKHKSAIKDNGKHSKWLRLCTNACDGSASGVNNFDITVKFKHQDDLNIFRRKLAVHFNMQMK